MTGSNGSLRDRTAPSHYHGREWSLCDDAVVDILSIQHDPLLPLLDLINDSISGNVCPRCGEGLQEGDHAESAELMAVPVCEGCMLTQFAGENRPVLEWACVAPGMARAQAVREHFEIPS
jgi:hypothetical protein